MGLMTKEDARDRMREPPLQVQAGNLPVLAEETIHANFLEALARHDGNLSKAAGAIGVSRHTVYRHMARENLFREQVGVVQALAIQGRAHELLQGVHDHLRNHIENGWEIVTDEDGNPVLDEDLEPLKRSVVSIKSLEGLAREMRHAAQGEPTTAVAINNINQAEANAAATAPRARPRLVRASSVNLDDIPDAEIVEETQG